ncbi:MAG: HAMP domain-containing protein, partial [Acidimicrobiia bacterium]
PAVSSSVSRSLGIQRENEELAREATVLMPVIIGRSRDGFPEWVGAIANQARYERQFLTSATLDEVRAFSDGIDSRRPGTSLLRLPATLGLPTALPTFQADPVAYYDAYLNQAGALDLAGRNVEDVIARVSADSANTARSEVWIYGGLAIFAMLFTLGLIWFVSRAVVRPVRKLTAAARDMSERRLPQLVESLRVGGDITLIEPVIVEVDSEDEIGELARAFYDVESVTTQVAVEQSRLLRKGMGDLFVNLARRNQSLLERQLELLDELERNEHDPGALDSLFKLDHMATRMRRNAESLLVLSGAEQPRQWQQPIPLVDVVRAAAAEIADFPRVELLGVDQQLAVSGRAVADLAHLIAELLENATQFSPPEAAVVVSGAGTADGFVLVIADQGIGLPAERLAAVNHLLARPPVVGLALTRALGLHVVGLLAVRLGIRVELRRGAPLGTMALVTIPQEILEGTGAPEPFVPVPDTPAESVPLTPRRAAWRPDDEPPVEEWRREGMVTATAMPPGPDPEPVNVAPPVIAVPPVYSAPPVSSVPVDVPPVAETSAPPTIADNPIHDDSGPLASRVPGHNLSHQPTSPVDVAAADADPLRPYHVHEMLTRHQIGKRRGQLVGSENGAGGDPDPEGEAP